MFRIIDKELQSLHMITIVCGTNRDNSVSIKISEIYRQILADCNAESEVIDLAQLPGNFLVSALYERSGKDQLFNPIREKMAKSDKFVFIVPEYNGSFPGVLKAFIDGLKFPDTFEGKKCALVGISSGVLGGGLALSHLTDIFNYCGMLVLPLKPRLASIHKNLKNGTITNELYNELLEMQAKQLVEF